MTLYELSYGLEYSSNKEEIGIFNHGISIVKSYLDIYNLKEEDVTIFGNLKLKYKKQVGIAQKAMKKNDLDFLIVSTAISQNAILISNDKIFETIHKIEPKFKYENWIKI